MRCKIKDICKPKQWKTISAEMLREEGYPVYGANGVIGYYSEYNHKDSTLLVTCRGATCGSLNICQPFSYVNGNAMALDELRSDVDIKYLYYYLKARGFNDVISGSAQPQIIRSAIEQIEIDVKSKDVQKEIVAKLELVENMILVAKEQMLDFDNLIKSRFVEMFGDVMHNSKNWCIRNFSDITSSRLGKMLDAKKQTGENTYPYLANFNVQWFRFNLENLNEMDFDFNERIEFELCEGDLLICEGGEIGRCAVWHNEIQPCYFQKALHRVRCNRTIIHPDYLSWWFKYNCEHDGFSAIIGGKATIAHLTGVKLKQLKVVVPPIELQEEFVDFVASVDKLKVAYTYMERKCTL